ncbi:hypothetical protein [Flagellimonas meridianipacifica]|uniref:Limiting CO2-inducible protein B/C beta carbonyic anhydrase domain-containing protein n=1 Tax=Flagellimonas meridianipacifica TaxID=1080225 RepID=A0A2T0MD63_9FLAO|nr:hypothetical protein [Allomuricauda pacifica]PRX55424.1 hypothetical protein CLV81_3836 [Allomuricauda pacifica]
MLQKKFEKVVLENYPDALDTRDTSIRYLGLLQNGHDIDISKMLMATSLCSDDINIPSTSFFSVVWGPFFLGGLGGLPYAGLTGLTAFAHHIPDHGTAFIFYGPHIGVTLENEVGKMYRPGQGNAGACCGALMLALERFKDDTYTPELKREDYQQTYLESLLFPRKDEILNDKLPQRKITECTFELIDKMLHESLREVKNEFKVDKIALLGGIVINTDFGIDDYFSVRNFEVIRTTYL